MTEYTDLFIRLGRAVETLALAEDYAQSADEGAGVTPGDAGAVAWDASSSLRTLGEKLIDLADRQAFAARRYDRAQRQEDQTGVEYRAGDAA